ncbi:serine/threonine protein kinase [Longilinea arvoryzae]|uniref:Serine/threonine protein kinase n=1 Tax=Longilinea arvoryzae TaxID=360412 RepID=A0A0S7BKP4_9CHLR|nr:serine/threonine-protein kinase [Longilinea arvoryzae]GAP14234.1 serine/threonine protein kinase [Longilinea arvoryzae]
MPIPLKAGEVLRGRYRIRRIIGQGGMGCIYLADDQRLEGRQCALKEVEHDRTLPQDMVREARDQFLREATVLARLDHPNLPKVSDFFSISTRDYLVMDYVPGKDLRTLMLEARQEGRFLLESEVLSWASQLCDALIYLHGQEPPILHRDIKPSNLKVTPSGLLKLVDFGLVKLLAPGEVTITVLQGQGTALYTPLEQYGGDSGHTDVRSDIYSFGATLYHLLTNQSPPDARDRFLDPESMLSPRSINGDVSPRTERAILWAMSLHPDERPESIDRFRQSLLGDRPSLPRAVHRKQTVGDYLNMPTEKMMLWAALGLTAVSFFVMLLR